MSWRYMFEVRHGFGKIDLLDADGGTRLAGIPSDLVEDPNLLKALLAIAEGGGMQVLDRTDISEVLVVEDSEIYRAEIDAR
ncbi:hypothetical protein CA223_05350 [Sphingomonas koreensis]|uniref:Uncharacterized protein n=2 Tax=Sphingomonas koreensis TaxID=93064 RepID=A0AAJ4S1H2_9SPHN|nr:hypothetical protein [Sphingomonas koreensis]MDC7809966.1 hypothetical protein [Sphingomonas koreensis]RSU24538.1 hypothetical protein CA224_02130 [Sphingomonas koreensis]RSU30142.1 hypothetical protein CA225_05625 [Sphingomonas koreensis]RSU37421.1 hypothetical protein BRX39_05900 [Sphingomonas koreensis]RSU42273.1 hypothetical protein CA223_05350 [Sphingomonas koreensis]